eukprot:6369398-Amphidinium_carterae.1
MYIWSCTEKHAKIIGLNGTEGTGSQQLTRNSSSVINKPTSATHQGAKVCKRELHINDERDFVANNGNVPLE